MDPNANEYQNISQSYPPVVDPPKKPKKPKIWLIIMTILFVAASAAAAYLFLQNQDSKNKINSLNGQLSDTKQQLVAAKAELDKANGQTSNTSSIEYFTLNNWNIKFIMPKGLEKSDIVYTAGKPTNFDDVAADSILLNTKKVAALDVNCVNDGSSSLGILGTIYRTKSAINENTVGVINISSDNNGYYYYYWHPQALCSSTKEGAAIEAQQATLVVALMGGIQ